MLLQYLITVGVGILLWVSDNDARWAEFKAPMHRVMVDPDQKVILIALMFLVPIFVGFVTFNQVRPTVAAPATLRWIHPSMPGQLNFQGTTLELASLENPLRSRGSPEEHYEEGKRVYAPRTQLSPSPVKCDTDGLAERLRLRVMGSIPDELRQAAAILDNLRRHPLDIATAESNAS